MKDAVIAEFHDKFGDEGDIRTFFAPGRVNLIGEHTDYNGGHVLPCALTIGTYAAVRLRLDEKINFYSMNFASLGVIERNINETAKDPEKGFTDYPLSVVWALKQQGYMINCGFDIVFYGNIPNSSGLSSSASIEVLMGYICKSLYALDIDNIYIAKIGQLAENQFIGVNCGIMDQFIIAMGKQDFATYLDTSTLKFDYIPVVLDDCSLVIACSNKKRGLGESKYNERRAECERAVSDIGGIKFLGELDEASFEQVKDRIKDPVCRKRAKHAVYENQRTIKACEALRHNDLETFGRLMNESHISLRDDYEVTGLELDTLVSSAWEQPGVIGSRMTGAGFGGCTVSIVKKDSINAFIKNVGDEYASKTDYKADFYVVSVGEGPKEI